MWTTRKQRMLRDIEMEVEYTRNMIGKAVLDSRVMAAMKEVPRHEFVPPEGQDQAYYNGPLPIGYGQTISQPSIVAQMTEALRVGPGDKVLEVGTGSGYQTAILCELCRQVYSVEVVAALSEAAAARLKRLGYANVETRIGNGYQGWPEHAPYDGIIVTAAATTIPQPLVEQLKPGARLVIPVGLPFFHQELMVVENNDTGATTARSILGVAFVPLTGGPGGRED